MITGKTVSMFQISQKSKGPKKLYIKFGHIFGINFVLIKFCDSDTFICFSIKNTRKNLFFFHYRASYKMSE